MSDASDSGWIVPGAVICTQCEKPIPLSHAKPSRHANPCGHVFCPGCVAQLEFDQARGPRTCRSPGCQEVLGPAKSFLVARCAHRPYRLAKELERLLSDQGNASSAEIKDPDGAPVHTEPTEEEQAAKELRVKSEMKLRMYLATSSGRDDRAWLLKSLLCPGISPSSLADDITHWANGETSRIRAWEAAEVERVHAVAEKCCGLVKTTAEHRARVGKGVLSQRLALRASLEELEWELNDTSTLMNLGERQRFARADTLTNEMRALVTRLMRGEIRVPTAGTVARWTEMPVFASEFGEEKNGSLGNLPPGQAGAVVESRLAECIAAIPEVTLTTDLPKGSSLKWQERKRRVISLGRQRPSCIAALDEKTVAIGSSSESSQIQAWDVVTGVKVRDFEGKFECQSLRSGPRGIAIATYFERQYMRMSAVGAQYGVCVFDTATGKLVHRLLTQEVHVAAMVDGHIVGLGIPGLLVWSPTAKGGFELKSAYRSPERLHSITILTHSTVALGTWGSGKFDAKVEIWDWRVGKVLQSINGLGESASPAALLPNGRLAIAGVFRNKQGDTIEGIVIVDTENPDGPRELIVKVQGIQSIAAARDGSFLAVGYKQPLCQWRDDVQGLTTLPDVMGSCVVILESVGAVVLSEESLIVIKRE